MTNNKNLILELGRIANDLFDTISNHMRPKKNGEFKKNNFKFFDSVQIIWKTLNSFSSEDRELVDGNMNLFMNIYLDLCSRKIGRINHDPPKSNHPPSLMKLIKFRTFNLPKDTFNIKELPPFMKDLLDSGKIIHIGNANIRFPRKLYHPECEDCDIPIHEHFSSKGYEYPSQFSNARSKDKLYYEIQEHADDINIVIEMPGVCLEEIKLKFDAHSIEVSTPESEFRRYFKHIEIGEEYNTDDIETQYRNGILELKIKKSR